MLTTKISETVCIREKVMGGQWTICHTVTHTVTMTCTPELVVIKENDKKQKYFIMFLRPKLRSTYSRTLFNINCMSITGNKLPAHTAQACNPHKSLMHQNLMNNLYLTADFGIEPYTRTLRPLYNPNTPCRWTVFLTQSKMPVYCFAAVPAFSSSCSCVFTYSVGYVIHISMPPVIPPDKGITKY